MKRPKPAPSGPSGMSPDGPVPSEEVVARVRAHTPRVLLSFSTGKDSIGAYLAIRDHFEEVVPYYLYLVPNLEFIEDSLRYYEEEVFKRRIVRLPHPSFYRMLDNMLFQPPERCQVIEDLDLPQFDYTDVNQWLGEDLGWPAHEVYTANGVRAADSPIRRTQFIKNGAINNTKQTFSPCWDWNKARLIEEIAASGIKLPCDYRLFSRTFDGLDLRFLWKIKEEFPRDYDRILEWFPLADMEIARYEFAQRRPPRVAEPA